MNERDCQIALSTFPVFGPRRTKLLLEYFGSASGIWNAKAEKLLLTGLNKEIVGGFTAHRSSFDPEKYMKSMAREMVRAITKYDPDYPTNLKLLEDAPLVLYVKGVLTKADEKSIAIVGTRLMTNYGREVAEKFAADLARRGVTVISGLAFGIDAAAQRSAFNAGGRTISVLASGLNIISPLANKPLALDFINGKKGAVVSEHPLGYTPQPFDFPVRDRLISGMAKGVIVIEGRMKSGTFHTVKAALDQGRPVFAVPGPINSPFSEATNYLIQNGAKLITGVNDIFEEIDIQTSFGL
jgi:DNA processing protein